MQSSEHAEMWEKKSICEVIIQLLCHKMTYLFIWDEMRWDETKQTAALVLAKVKQTERLEGIKAGEGFNVTEWTELTYH